MPFWGGANPLSVEVVQGFVARGSLFGCYFLDGSSGAVVVEMLSTNCADHTFILPKSIEHQGKTYEVSLIGDYAFENAPSSVEEVVVKKNVKYIGAKSFRGQKQ